MEMTNKKERENIIYIFKVVSYMIIITTHRTNFIVKMLV